MTELAMQIQARKARLQRFAEAAIRYENRKLNERIEAQVVLLKAAVPEKPTRRQYEHPTLTPDHTPITWRIFRAVSEEFAMPVSEIIGQSRDMKYTLPRYVIMGLMLEMTNISMPGIGRRLGGRDHTTVINGRNRINELLKSESFRNRFDQIKAAIING